MIAFECRLQRPYKLTFFAFSIVFVQYECHWSRSAETCYLGSAPGSDRCRSFTRTMPPAPSGVKWPRRSGTQARLIHEQTERIPRMKRKHAAAGYYFLAEDLNASARKSPGCSKSGTAAARSCCLAAAGCPSSRVYGWRGRQGGERRPSPVRRSFALRKTKQERTPTPLRQ